MGACHVFTPSGYKLTAEQVAGEKEVDHQHVLQLHYRNQMPSPDVLWSARLMMLTSSSYKRYGSSTKH